jgi:glyoxylase-like metal-dependent hydrolase (beta-lactamase superfamily II)
MHIHHLNCATLRPFAFVLSDTATLTTFAHLVVHCLLVETNDGLVLVDCGFGIADRVRPTPLEHAFMTASRSSRDLAEAAARQVVSLGYAIKDVRHIVQTHLHLDHAGGLPDFQQAQIHVHAVEYDAAMHPRTFRDLFYLPTHWSHNPKWVPYTSRGQTWFGLEAVRVLEGVSPAIWLVPLAGHTRGHCAVAVQAANRWLLHCGDAYISRSDIDPERAPRSRPAWAQPLARSLFPHAPRLRTLLDDHEDEVELFCAHDPDELARLQSGNCKAFEVEKLSLDRDSH